MPVMATAPVPAMIARPVSESRKETSSTMAEIASPDDEEDSPTEVELLLLDERPVELLLLLLLTLAPVELLLDARPVELLLLTIAPVELLLDAGPVELLLLCAGAVELLLLLSNGPVELLLLLLSNGPVELLLLGISGGGGVKYSDPGTWISELPCTEMSLYHATVSNCPSSVVWRRLIPPLVCDVQIKMPDAVVRTSL